MAQLLAQNYWGGVCGFVSVIHGILLRKGSDNALDGLSQDELEYNLGLSILAFLRHVKVSKPRVADDIVNFTRTFGSVHATKTIDNLIFECETAVNNIKVYGGTEGAEATEEGWGIAMSKFAIVSYMEFVGVKCIEKPNSGEWTQENFSKLKNCVVGVGTKAKRTELPYHGLRHWVYINDAGVMYNWGARTVMGKSPNPPYTQYSGTHTGIIHVLQLI